MVRSTRRSTVLAALVCSALVVAACAGDDDDDVSSDTASPSVETTATTTAETDAGTAPTVTAAGTTEPSAPDTTDRDDGRPTSGSPVRARTTSRTRASRSRAARWCSAWRPTPPTPGRRTGPATRRAASSRCRRSPTRCSPITDEGEIVPAARRVGRAQRRLHRVDAAHPRGHHVPRRHPARRRRGQVQHRRQPGRAAHRRRAGADRHRDGVGPGRRDHDSRAGRGSRCPTYLSVRLDRVHDVADVAGEPARRPAAHRGRSGLRRRRRGDAGRRQPGRSRSGSARSCSSRTRRATATRSAPCATRTTGAARTASPARTCRTSTPSRRSSRSTSTAARTRCGRASSTPCTPPTPTPSASSSTTTAWRSSSSSRYGDTSYYLINVAEGPELDPEGANAASPLLNVHCRRALAHAMDRQRMTEERGAGLVLPANGPFPPGSLGYLEDNGYPEFDLDLANEEMDQCLARPRHRPIDFRSTPRTTRSTSRPARSWSRCGPRRSATRSRSTITPIEQGQYIGLALIGDFNVLQWRGHGGLDPDQQRLWWQKASASPIGKLALNFGRFQDDVIDEALQTIKSNPDPAARKEAAETINRRFGEQVYIVVVELDAVGRRHPAVRQRRRAQRPARRHGGHRPGLRRPPPGQPDLVRRRRLRVTPGCAPATGTGRRSAASEHP